MNRITFKIQMLVLLIAIPVLCFGSSTSPDPDFYQNFAFNLIGIVGAVVVITAIAFLIQMLMLSIKLRELQLYEEKGLEHLLETKTANQVSWIKRLYKKLTAVVPIEQEKDILLNHDYDGIQELDNNLPPWWLYGFYLSIGVSIFYVAYYHFSDNAKSSAELYAIEMEEAEAAVERYLASQANRVDETNVTFLSEPAALSEGKGLFQTYCAACHMPSGGGASNSVGPNLTDEYWLHGGGIKNIFKTIKYGVPAKGMIAWKDQLRPAEIHKISSFIMSIQGSNPENAKGPQGEIYADDSNTTAKDSTSITGMN